MIESASTVTSERLALAARLARRPRPWTIAWRMLALPFFLGRRSAWFSGRIGGERAIVAEVGRAGHLRSLSGRLWDDDCLPTPLETSPESPAALELVEVHPWLVDRYRARGWLILPQRIRWLAALDALPPARPGKSLRANLKKAESQGFAIEMVDRPTCADWREFEDGMMKPHARRRFGDEMWSPAAAVLRVHRARGALLFVIRGRQRVAGACLLRRSRELWMPTLGVRGGEAALVDAGVITAIYRAAIERARASDADRFDVGCTSALVNDGIAAYKRRWGFSPIPDPLSPSIAIRVDPAHRGLARALAREPMLISTASGLRVHPDPSEHSSH